MKIIVWSVAIACGLGIAAARAQETPPLQFVSEYLREFGAVERIRLASEREFQAPNQNMVASCIGMGNRYGLEITQQIARMRGMQVLPPSQTLPERLVELYGRKLSLYREVVNACAALKEGAKSNVSSLEVMATVSRYNAMVDALDHSLFMTSTEAFSTLLSAANGSHSTPRRLSISLAQKRALLRQLATDFGAELDDDQQTYLVNAASVIRDAVRAHKASDE